jgi:hypothetical protein
LRSIISRPKNSHPRNKTRGFPEKAVKAADLFFSTANKTKAEMQVRKRKGK